MLSTSITNMLGSSPSPQHRPRGSSAFTLIELLVVITIIAILAGLLLPVTASVMRTARKTSAKSTETQIVTAINSYQTDYSQYPIPTTFTNASGTNDFGYDNTSAHHNAELFDVLRALNTQNTSSSAATSTLNSRQIVYFESKNVKSTTTPKDGFVVTMQGPPVGNKNVSLAVGDLVDPFGNLYCITMDANYNNEVPNPYSDNGTASPSDPGTTPADVLRTGVIVWSVGEDGQLGNAGANVPTPYTPTPGDDVDSWQ